ncbi:MAG: tRNA epoxyqueuosine(34) reductase QueG [Xanthomonadales bacterium]|nr:tRNA epoxyqueuosine(34) reductase QueG [Xanthomonadales bacterium]
MPTSLPDPHALASTIKEHAADLGFSACGITGTRLDQDESHLLRWLDDGFHGEMDYMQRHGTRRSRPDDLVPGTLTVISVRMDYLSRDAADMQATLDDKALAYVSRYALGRDYHKLMRNRLQQLADRIAGLIGPFGYRAFVDSAPVLERALARNAGLGWIGKNALLIDRRRGSWSFVGELYSDLPLPHDAPESGYYCGTCTRCIDVCPTGAIVAPNRIDARRCISYLTIELHGPIPEDLRSAIGNRVFGCDDCQLVCPWNKFAQPTRERDFAPRHGLDRIALVDAFAWSEAEFLTRSEGSPLRRIGHERWLRNLAVALGNAPTTPEVIAALQARHDDPSELVREHVRWALARHDSA